MRGILLLGRVRTRTIILSSMMVLSVCLLACAYQKQSEAELGKIQPQGELSILIRLDEKTLYLFSDGQVCRQYAVAVGRQTTPSPIGEWHVVWKDADWGTGFGTRWLGLDVPWGTFGIHGTNKPWSIGARSSHGCIRMRNRDVEELYDLVPLGTSVKIEGMLPNITERLHRSMTGQSVVALQLRLRERGYLNGRADGIYGQALEEAVRAFQRDRGLAITGIADDAVIEKLAE